MAEIRLASRGRQPGGDVVHAVRCYGHLVRMWIRAALAYPASFWMTMAGNLAASGMDFVVIVVMFLHTRALGGWSLPQVAFLYGTSGLTLGLADLLVGSMDQLGVRVREGSVDTVLVRPVPALAQFAGDRFALRRIGRVLQSGAVLAWSLAQLHPHWTPLKGLVFVSLVVCGTVIFGSLYVGGSAFHFFMADAAEVQNSFTYGGATMLQYPPTIYARDIVRGTVYGVPLAFVNWLPALYLLGRHDPLGLPSWYRFASPAAALLCATVAGLLWRAGIRSYRSTGS